MSDARPPEDDDQDPSDWLTSQFDPTGELPKQKPEQPPAAQPPAQPAVPSVQPPVQPPVQQPAQPQQPILPPQFPVQPGTPQQARPARQVPPVAQQSQQPQQPAVPPAQQQPPAQQPPAQQPPAQGGGFSWGLTPGSEPTPPAQVPPAATPPAATQPAATPPAATPPAAPANPAAPAAPGTWFEPAAPAAPATPPPAQQPLFPQAQPSHPEPHEPAPLDPAIAGVPHESQPPAAPLPFETAALPDVAPDARDAPPFWEPEPTQMMEALDVPEPRTPEPPKQPFGRTVFPEGTELLPEQPASAAQPTAAFGAPAGETGPVSALDALFGESQFKEYDAGIVAADPNENPFARREVEVGGGGAGGGGSRPSGPAPAVSRLQRILLTVLGSVLAVLALIGLFFLGIRLPAMFGPAPAVTAPSETPDPAETPGLAVGPVAPGTYRFDELLGRECIDPYESPWQDEYTVVDCNTPHAAQMARRGEIPEDETLLGAYPTEEVLQSQVLSLCRAGGIFSTASSEITDGVVSGSYPTEEQWAEGSRAYFCFLTRSSGEPLARDYTLPQVVPTPTPTATDTP